MDGDGESGGSVVEDEPPSSASLLDDGVGDVSRMVGSGSVLSCLERTFWVILVCENIVFFGCGGARYSSTVDRIAVVISSLEV
jgi:hypothetical protein